MYATHRNNNETKTIKINGESVDVPANAIAYKYADPTEGARWLFDENELLDIMREDISLIVMAPHDAP